MKKTRNVFSGLILLAMLIFVAFTLFTAPVAQAQSAGNDEALSALVMHDGWDCQSLHRMTPTPDPRYLGPPIHIPTPTPTTRELLVCWF